MADGRIDAVPLIVRRLPASISLATLSNRSNAAADYILRLEPFGKLLYQRAAEVV